MNYKPPAERHYYLTDEVMDFGHAIDRAVSDVSRAIEKLPEQKTAYAMGDWAGEEAMRQKTMLQQEADQLFSRHRSLYEDWSNEINSKVQKAESEEASLREIEALVKQDLIDRLSDPAQLQFLNDAVELRQRIEQLVEKYDSMTVAAPFYQASISKNEMMALLGGAQIEVAVEQPTGAWQNLPLDLSAFEEEDQRTLYETGAVRIFIHGKLFNLAVREEIDEE